jgi:hypothetical protein
MTRTRRAGLLLAGLAMAALPAVGRLIVVACGGWWNEAVTVDATAPAASNTTFSTGQPGIVRPTFTREYLVLAYRRFAGLRGGIPSNAPGSYSGKRPIQRWLDAREAVLGTKLAVTEWQLSFRSLPEYREFFNCLDSAWTTATETLTARAQKLGATSPAVRDWLAAQDAVFTNCGDAALTLPAAPRPGATPLERADRAYQLGAAYFYGMDYERAEALFRAIGEDRQSEWRPWGRYLAARALLRRATLKATGAETPGLLSRAERELEAIQHDPSLASMHDRARSLAGYVAGVARPVERLHAVSARLSAAGTMAAQDLVDYQLLFDNKIYRNVESGYAGLPQLEALRDKDDLTDWILVMQGWHEDARLRALDRWRATRSPAWLVASLWKLRAADREVPEVLEAASRVPRESPAFATLVFLRTRLLFERSDMAGARQVLDTLPDPADRSGSATEGAPADSLNLLRAERLLLARSLPELLRYAPRWVVAQRGFWQDQFGDSRGADPNQRPDGGVRLGTPHVLDLDGKLVLNQRLPLAVLAQAVALPETAAIRPQLARAAWTRAVLTGRQAVAEAVAPVVVRENKGMADDIARWQKAAGAARHHAAIYTLLRHPGLGPYVDNTDAGSFNHQRGNWWCAPLPASQPAAAGPAAGSIPDFQSFPYYRAVAMPERFPGFLADADRVALAEERNALAAVGTAPNYLAAEAVAWAKADPKNPLVAEALALAVEGTRWGCGDEGTGSRSKEAFRTLHKLFPGSTWARKTKYWYGRD